MVPILIQSHFHSELLTGKFAICLRHPSIRSGVSGWCWHTFAPFIANSCYHSLSDTNSHNPSSSNLTYVGTLLPCHVLVQYFLLALFPCKMQGYRKWIDKTVMFTNHHVVGVLYTGGKYVNFVTLLSESGVLYTTYYFSLLGWWLDDGGYGDF